MVFCFSAEIVIFLCLRRKDYTCHLTNLNFSLNSLRNRIVCTVLLESHGNKTFYWLCFMLFVQIVLKNTYIIGHYNPLVRITSWLLTPLSDATYSLTSSPNDRFWQIYLLSELLPEICWEEVAEEIFSYLIFDDWPGMRAQAFVSNKPTYYILDHGDFITNAFAYLELLLAAFHVVCILVTVKWQSPVQPIVPNERSGTFVRF